MMIRRHLILGELLAFIVLCCAHTGLTRQIASSNANSRPVELIWGIEEVQTPLGKLLNFTIPKDAFAGEIADIKVTEADQSSLPAWLTFDAKSRQFLGWPVLAKDVGAHYIAVSVFGADGASVQDVFTLIVKDGDTKPQCASEAAHTILTLLLDLDWDSLTIPEKIALLAKFSSYMDVQVTEFKVSPVTGSGTTALFDSTALIAGPGNAKEVKFPGIKLSTVVGCDGNVDGSRNKELTTFVEESAKDGSMARFTGIDALGWTLTSSKPVPSQRIRRQNFLNTPEPSPIPTMVVQPGGGVVATPYLHLLAPPGGRPTDLVQPTVVLPGIRPTAPDNGLVRPTAVVAGAGQTPELTTDHYPVTPSPPLPPPGPRPEGGAPGPKVGKPIAGGEAIVAVGGSEFRYQIPKDAYVTVPGADPKVTLLEKTESNIWLKLEQQNDGTYLLRGLPLADAKGEKQYHFDVSESGKTIQIPFKIRVEVADDTALNYNHEAEVVLNEDYNEFNVDRRLKFVDTVRSYYGDPDAKHVIVRAIKAGSTIVSWTNDTYRGKQCGDADFDKVSEKLVSKDGIVNPDFQKFAENSNGFKVDKVMVRKIGPCAESAKQEAGTDIYLSMVVPIVVVSSLLLIACCIGCLLYRKKRRGKMTPEPDQQIFGGKNKPVIFKGEISESNGAKGNNGNSKKPAVLADERPAVAPPLYPGRSPTPGHHAHLAQHDDIDRDPREQEPLLYLPPSGGDVNSPPHIQLKPSSKK